MKDGPDPPERPSKIRQEDHKIKNKPKIIIGESINIFHLSSPLLLYKYLTALLAEIWLKEPLLKSRKKIN